MKELAIYVHLPFCVQKCLYCDFLSGPTHLSLIDEYIEKLTIEMQQHKEFVQKYKIRSIFLGGGTPSILNVIQIEKVMNALYDIIGNQLLENAEITIESNPGTLTEEKLKKYLELGINRISMGLQSTHNDELKNLGRIHSYEDFLDGFQKARNAGFKNINIDLMSGLPEQTLEKYETTLNRMIALNPEHISAYSLIVEEGTKFYEKYGTEEGMKKLPDEDTDRLMYQRTKEILSQAGYQRYEISNYAKEGYESRHNISYWTGIDYIGFGLGSSSYFQKKRYHNEENMKYYLQKLSQNENVMNLDEELTLQDQMEEFMILGLRMIKGISKTEFEERFQKDVLSVYGGPIQKLLQLNLLEENGDYLYLTEQGINVSNEIFTMFLD